MIPCYVYSSSRGGVKNKNTKVNVLGLRCQVSCHEWINSILTWTLLGLTLIGRFKLTESIYDILRCGHGWCFIRSLLQCKVWILVVQYCMLWQYWLAMFNVWLMRSRCDLPSSFGFFSSVARLLFGRFRFSTTFQRWGVDLRMTPYQISIAQYDRRPTMRRSPPTAACEGTTFDLWFWTFTCSILNQPKSIFNMELPVPDQLQKQLEKCKTIREVDHHKSRTKTPKVSYVTCRYL